jgi:cytochrome P450
MITPTFHFKILDTFIDVFNENSQILVDKLMKKSDGGEVFDIFPFITRCALDIICGRFSSVEMNGNVEELLVDELLLLQRRPWGPKSSHSKKKLRRTSKLFTRKSWSQS